MALQIQFWNRILRNDPELSRARVRFQPLSVIWLISVLLDSVKLTNDKSVKSGLGLTVSSKYTPSIDIFGPKMYDPSSRYGDTGAGTKNDTANVCATAA